jgi:hypothetical protein
MFKRESDSEKNRQLKQTLFLFLLNVKGIRCFTVEIPGKSRET